MVDLYSIEFNDNEIYLKQTYCKLPQFCKCNTIHYCGEKCGYPLEQAKQKAVDYYKERAEYIERLSYDQFLYEKAGIYPEV